ncbi:MAG TPA: translation initiation factor IF-5A [Candidatus Nanoarchaeia archaeon]|nr:translation initiation factor IF-5A [Candidatus Nanoarchaeia archaeon]
MAEKQTTAGGVKDGDTILLEGQPCRVANVSRSKPGKHGAAKARIVAIGIIDGKKRDVVMPGHERLEVPIIQKKSAQVLSVAGNSANVMDMESFETFDLEIPEELRGKVTQGVHILYWIIMEAKMMKQIKSESSQT